MKPLNALIPVSFVALLLPTSAHAQDKILTAAKNFADVQAIADQCAFFKLADRRKFKAALGVYKGIGGRRFTKAYNRNLEHARGAVKRLSRDQGHSVATAESIYCLAGYNLYGPNGINIRGLIADR